MGGDLAEKSSFTIGKRIAAECFLMKFYIFYVQILKFFMGAMLMKIVILLKENESHIIKKINKCEKNVNT